MLPYGIYCCRMTTNETAASKIDAVMTRKARSQKWVAEAANIPLTTFRRKLKDGSTFTLAEVLSIALALEVSPTDLLPTEFERSPQFEKAAA